MAVDQLQSPGQNRPKKEHQGGSNRGGDVEDVCQAIAGLDGGIAGAAVAVPSAAVDMLERGWRRQRQLAACAAQRWWTEMGTLVRLSRFTSTVV